MSKKIQITTKTGDAGLTSLANGQRVTKSDPIFAVIGDLDEVNAWLGKVATLLRQEKDRSTLVEQHQQLLSIQEQLFVIGGEIARSPKSTVTESQVRALESVSERLESLLEANWHTKFVLPGGTVLAADIDIARTVCRRLERSLIVLGHHQEVSSLIRQYVNRLSDYLYLLRCLVNQLADKQEELFDIKKLRMNK